MDKFHHIIEESINKVVKEKQLHEMRNNLNKDIQHILTEAGKWNKFKNFLGYTANRINNFGKWANQITNASDDYKKLEKTYAIIYSLKKNNKIDPESAQNVLLGIEKYMKALKKISGSTYSNKEDYPYQNQYTYQQQGTQPQEAQTTNNQKQNQVQYPRNSQEYEEMLRKGIIHQNPMQKGWYYINGDSKPHRIPESHEYKYERIIKESVRESIMQML